ncbi:hypothetical protein KY347_00975 [Candidatus Woesearchaeota archaeon]|nr:hypothetical protein [Candidatus Woesearchaeota archaeon]
MRKRWKRKSGYFTPRLAISKKDLIKYDLFINPYYDDWNDYRDGLRDWYGDFKKIKRIDPGVACYREDLYKKRIKMNLKQKSLLKRRQAGKCMEKLLALGK